MSRRFYARGLRHLLRNGKALANAAADGGQHAHELHRFRHVVNAHDGGPRLDADSRRRKRRHEQFARRPPENAADEALAARREQDRVPERAQVPEALEDLEIGRRLFAELEPGIDRDGVTRDAGRERALRALAQKRDDLAKRVARTRTTPRER